jgi:MYXO-CTERM domain-containing protein
METGGSSIPNRDGVGSAALVLALAALAWPSLATAQVTLEPDPLPFNGVRVGTTSSALSVTIENTANNPLNQVTCTITPDTADVFAVVSGECPATVAANSTAEVLVTFAPDSRGAAPQAALVVQFLLNGTPGSESVSLTGTGIAPQMQVSTVPVAEGALDFGTAPAGTAAPITFIVRVENTGTDVLNAQLTESGTNQGDWSYDLSGSNFSVGVDQTRDITASFQPGAIGARSATVIITDRDGLSSTVTREFDMVGIGSDPVAIALSTTALTFGTLDVQLDPPVTRQIVVSNPGSQALNISQMRLVRQDDDMPYEGGAFAVLTAVPLQVPPGAQRAIDVRYQPTVESVGDFARLVLTTNSVDTPEARVTLSGRGIDRHIQVSPPSIGFRPAYRNTGMPEQRMLTVENTGESPLSLTTMAPMGEDGESFALVGPLDGLIEPQGSSTLTLEFRPRIAAEEPLTSTLFIVNDDDSRPMVRIDLTGMGILPPIMPSVGQIDWGPVAVGLDLPPPGARGFSIRNDSDQDTFVVQEVRVVDGDGQPLDGIRAIGPRDPRELAPGAELAIDVAFAPERGGSFDGEIQVLVDADPLPVVSVLVSGTAIETDARGGAGCSAAGSPGPGGSPGATWFAIVVVAGLALRRRAGRAALVALIALLPSRTATAQVQASQDLDLASFRPVYSIDPIMVTVESNDIGESGSTAVGLSFHYARNPLILRAAGGEMVDHPVSSRATTELAVAFAFGGRFEVAGVAAFLAQSGDPPQFSAIEPAEGVALGDLRLRGKAFLAASGRIRFGASAELTVPTALDTQFAGAEGPSALARGIVDYRRGRLHLAGNAGALMRERVRLADVEQGHELVYAGAAAYQVSPSLHGVAELFGSIGLSGGPAGARPLEAVVAARYRVTREIGLVAGAGRGLLAGVGAPELRGFVGLAWSPAARPIASADDDPRALTDDDRDGVVKRDDRCPDQIEDMDRFEDGDGCPDRDDDRDGVDDRLDRCPRQPEDRDHFADDDGCPDSDNDGDHVRDVVDRCPLNAEDLDKFEDRDGCPDPDNDADGVVDENDRCPAEKETINGNKDDDGCADPGDGLVLVTADKIETLEPVRFRGDGSVLTRASQRLLGQVAATLRAHREIARVRIRVHVHPRRAGDEDLSVTRAEAVRRWLVEWGIEPDRVEGVGMGSRKPLMPGGGAHARTMNDRVEFEIALRRQR